MDKCVLVVDDDNFTRRYLKVMLEGRGYHVVDCASLAPARSAIETFNFNLAVIDGLLPDGSGVEFAKGLTCPVIFCSGLTDEFNRKAMWSLGTVYQKPVDASFNQCVNRVAK